LPATLCKRNLFKRKLYIHEDIAKGVFALLAVLDKSTGNNINGGWGMAMLL